MTNDRHRLPEPHPRVPEDPEDVSPDRYRLPSPGPSAPRDPRDATNGHHPASPAPPPRPTVDATERIRPQALHRPPPDSTSRLSLPPAAPPEPSHGTPHIPRRPRAGAGGPPTPPLPQPALPARRVAGGPAGPRGGPVRSALSFGRELGVVVLIALILSLLIKTFLLQPFWIPSGSMNNTLVYGDRVIVSKLTPEVTPLERGDVIVFTDPGGWLDEPVSHPNTVERALQFVGLYPAGDNHLIKRVIGLPGDHVQCCNGAGLVMVNGVAIHEPYVYPGNPPSMKPFNITVPKGKVWVMGDHRSDSGDSRFHDDGTGRTGSVPEKDITGRAIAIVWPVDRITWLSNYSSTFAKVPNR